MSQHDYNLADQPGASFRSDLNAALSAIQTDNSGPTEPLYTVAYMTWADTATNLLKQRNSTNTGWITLRSLTSAYLSVEHGGTSSSTPQAARAALEIETSQVGSTKVAAGTEAQRDVSPQQGYFRFNSTIGKFEGYNGTSWVVSESPGSFNADGSVTYSTPQRGTVTTDNDLSFNMGTTNYFTCTPTAGGTLAFTNISAGQSGNIKFVNTANYSISKSAYIKASTTLLSTISVSGTYWLSYFSPDGIEVLVSNSLALS